MPLDALVELDRDVFHANHLVASESVCKLSAHMSWHRATARAPPDCGARGRRTNSVEGHTHVRWDPDDRAPSLGEAENQVLKAKGQEENAF